MSCLAQLPTVITEAGNRWRIGATPPPVVCSGVTYMNTGPTGAVVPDNRPRGDTTPTIEGDALPSDRPGF
jgi:hypothetical protein